MSPEGPLTIRSANVADAAAIQAIYEPYVRDTTVSFEENPPDTAEIERRLQATLPSYPFLVAEASGEVLGYAYANQHRTRSAYRTSVDVAIYVAPSAQRRGVGRSLLATLLKATAERGYHAAYAGIALPNEASVGLHEGLGFTPVGIYREVGQKFGRWIDVGWWQRLL